MENTVVSEKIKKLKKFLAPAKNERILGFIHVKNKVAYATDMYISASTEIDLADGVYSRDGEFQKGVEVSNITDSIFRILKMQEKEKTESHFIDNNDKKIMNAVIAFTEKMKIENNKITIENNKISNEFISLEINLETFNNINIDASYLKKVINMSKEICYKESTRDSGPALFFDEDFDYLIMSLK
jgi:hypothetical protein